MRTLTFRNVGSEPSDPVDTWPFEALVTAIERGTVGDWVRITAAVDADPWGEVARQIEEYLAYARPYGVGPLLKRAVVRARAQAAAGERATVVDEVSALVAATGLPLAEVARRLGTSRSRLSTYRSGRVVPSSTFMVRLRNLVNSGVTGRLAEPTPRSSGCASAAPPSNSTATTS